MRSIRILLVEDNPGDIELTREGLTESGKLKNQLDVVTDGEQAIDYLYKKGQFSTAETPDIILLDLNLPKLDGREILAIIKSDPNLLMIPVIILSSSEANTDIQESYNLHANCFITKPIVLDSFLKVINMIEYFWIDVVRLSDNKKT
jgi:CheY-like chemotaxis protein